MGGQFQNVTASCSGLGSRINANDLVNVSVLVSQGGTVTAEDILNDEASITSTLDGAGSFTHRQ